MNSSSQSRLGLAAAVLLGLVATFGLPQVVDLFNLMQLTVFVVMSILALSLALIWGYGGILCFGQAAFFGLGGYAYALAALNMDESPVPILLSIAVPAVFALLLGYFMFYGRISNVYLGVITLTVSLILYNLVNSTSGEQYRIGVAPIGGFNGIPSVPAPHLVGRPDLVLDPEGLWYVAALSLILVYLGLRALIGSHFGRVVIAIRENEVRASLLGYDTRLYKLLVFTIGGGIAGYVGCLFDCWGAFVSPTVFGLGQSAQIIIWVIVGGLGTLIGPIIGCLVMEYLVTVLGTQQTLDSNLVLGAILVVFVLAVPKGVVPLVGSVLGSLQAKLEQRSKARTARAPAEARQ